LSKGKNKKEVLNLYAAEINNQRRYMKKAEAKTVEKANERTTVSSSDEDSPNDQHNVECLVEDIPKRKKRKVTIENQSTEITEEKAFKDKIMPILDKPTRLQMSPLCRPKNLYLPEINQ
jgi:hypothetical protein